ncbi:MAG TPA: AAA family ATPase [Bryobacteraceae bacterium]|nr:AAA family ATPase [Bryobacteraceae bacterium]
MADTLSAVTPASIDRAAADLQRVRQEIARVIVAQDEIIEGVLICLIAGGHVLLEGVPGLGKTTLLRTLSRVLALQYSRIQFTPDLMPGDIVGSVIMDDEHGHKSFRFQPGPIFSNLVLADEINRATPKTQSALLEAMQERTVTSGTNTYSLSPPFLVMATQNPIEMEGTYPLPEAQLDRFLMKLLVNFPSRADLSRIVDLTTKAEEVADLRQVLNRDQIAELKTVSRQVIVAPHVQDYAIELIMATQPGVNGAPEITNKYIRYGSSPRGAQALVECGRVLALMRGRLHLSLEDVTKVAPAVLRHRIILNFDAHADGHNTETILQKIMEGASDDRS